MAVSGTSLLASVDRTPGGPESLQVEAVDPLADSRWEREVAAHPDAGPFHSTAWARVLNETYGHRPIYLCVSRGGKPVALIPFMEVRSWLTSRRGISLPFSDSCAPLFFASVESSEIVDEVIKLQQNRRWNHFEIRGDGIAPRSATPSATFIGHTLDLRAGAEAIFDSFDSSVRRAIRKARQGDVIVHVDHSLDGMRNYYRLHGVTRKRHGVPPQSWRFFKNIHESMIGPGRGFVALATHGSRVIAGAVYLRRGRNAVYKFGASDETAQEFRGNNLVMWEAISKLAESGAEVLDFGRTSPDNEGLRRFKQGWGCVENDVNYYKWKGTWRTGHRAAAGSHTAIFSRLPLSINRLLGEVIYPHLD